MNQYLILINNKKKYLKSKIKKMSLLKKLIYKLKKFRLNLIKRDRNFKVGDYNIVLPYYHSLPEIQNIHPKYDTFLPHLSKFLKADSFIVDVGANCGDTLSGMISENKDLNFICIEADKKFMEYLTKNTNNIKINSNKKIILCNSFIGSEIKEAYLEGNGGTKSAKINGIKTDQKLSTIKLDELLSQKILNNGLISLLKIDVDGYDYDVINSSKKTIKKYKPLIFFECDCDSQQQRENYIKTIKNLSKQGYAYWAVFDNFGSFIFQTSNLSMVFEILNYIWLQDLKKNTRTFNYVDIFCADSENKSIFVKALSKFELKII